jgi:hypothetical protein
MTAITPSEAKPRSRRAILIGALGGLGAVAARAIGRPEVAKAANGDPILVGQVASGTVTTQLQYSSSFASGLYVTATSASGGYGIAGVTNATGGGWAAIRGDANGGGNTYGVQGIAAGTTGETDGVRGTTASPAGNGVHGSSATGTGVLAESNSGTATALRVAGRAKFSTSGVATISAGTTSKTVTPNVNVTSGSFVLLTPKTNIGSRALWFTTNPSGDTFRVHMSSTRSTGTRVAWLLLG